MKLRLKDSGLLGPITEAGVCDQCASSGDTKPKLVKRFDDSDNLYLCAGCHVKAKHEPEGASD